MKNIRLYWMMAATAVSVMVASLVIYSCGSVNLFSTQDDVNLGKQVSQQIDSDPAEYPILRNPEITSYVQGIVNEILRSPDIRYKTIFPYQVQIINRDDIVNAFCTPGGYIYVYTGLLKFVDNEATLAGVLAHEIAHAEERHATKRMTTALGAQVLTDIVLGNNPSQTSQLAANLFTGLGLLKNSRDDEMQADDDSFKYLKSTRWYPGAIKMFFDKIMGQGASKGGELERLLSTHPLPQDRIEATDKRLKNADIPPPSEANLFTRRYQQMKARI